MAAAAPPLLTACGSRGGVSVPPPGLAVADVHRFLGGAGARPAAVSAVQTFSIDLYKQIAKSQQNNVICSPYSVAVALAMTRNGALGRTASELDTVLGLPELLQLNEGMDSLTLLMESRSGEHRRGDGSKAMISLDVANSLWGQKGEAWQPTFLHALSRYYGAGMHLVNYREDAENSRRAINAWVSDRTHAKIPHLLAKGLLDASTRLVLANAMYLKAPWESPFVEADTRSRPFTRADGKRIMTDTMEGADPVVVTHGPTWTAARLLYAGRQLAMTVVIPAHSLVELESALDAASLLAMLAGGSRSGKRTLTLPKWSFRLSSPLAEYLTSMGMPTAFDPRLANFRAMTHDEKLYISEVQHEAFIAVDEQGTEAAAATAVMMVAGGMPPPPPPPLVVDRPFLFVLHDVESATPLFIGRVTDPSAT